ncbi:MAG: hypothetical protein V8Q25_12275 [Roseburia faecis]
MVNKEQEEKFAAFKEDDLKNNRGRIINSMDEIRFLISHPKECAIHQKVQLNEILTFATLFSDYYKDYADFKTLQDFPVVDKNVYRENWNKIAVKKYSELPDSRVKYTSGSTGTPFKMVLDRARHGRWIAGNKVFREIVGMESHDKGIYVSANITDKHIPIDRQIRDNMYYIDCAFLDRGGVNDFIDYLVDNDIHYMTILASALERICLMVQEGKVKPWTGHFVGIDTQSDMLKESTRKIASEYFKCPVTDTYGCEEFGVIASEDGSGYGRLVNNADLYVEVLELDRDVPVKEGEIGRLVITDLYNKAFPMIRYALGDLGSIITTEDGKQYLNQLAGRQADMLYTTDGKPVNYFYIISLLEPYQDIKQFQLIQQDYTHFKWILNTENHSYEEMIVEYSKNLFGKNSEWKFEYVTELPKLKSGKRKMTVCNIVK